MTTECKPLTQKQFIQRKRSWWLRCLARSYWVFSYLFGTKRCFTETERYHASAIMHHIQFLTLGFSKNSQDLGLKPKFQKYTCDNCGEEVFMKQQFQGICYCDSCLNNKFQTFTNSFYLSPNDYNS